MTNSLRELALAYRILGSYNIGVGVLAHLTMRGAGGTTFWTYQLGQSVEEVRTADLIEVDTNLKPVLGKGTVNPSLSIHGKIYAARPDIQVIVHHHGANGVALGAIGANVVAFDQHSARWHDEIALAEIYESPLLESQSTTVADAIGNHKALLLKYHGTLVTGCCLEDAIVSTVELDAVCAAQLKAMSAGAVHTIPAAELDDLKQVMGSDIYYRAAWAYYLRRLNRLGLDQDIDDVAPATFRGVDVDMARDYTPSRREI